MRFLLHSATPSHGFHAIKLVREAVAAASTCNATVAHGCSSSPTSQGSGAEPPAKPSLVASHSQSADNEKIPEAQKAWGQQCSPRCGCVVRFECRIDPTTDFIHSATYHAKTVLATERNGTLSPQLTHTGKPLLTECQCKTLHTLGSRITEYLPNQQMARVRNMTEYDGVRSSEAFRRAVLSGNGLARSDGHCFDLVEEAFLALVRGHMPKPRRGKRVSETGSPSVDEEEQITQSDDDVPLLGYPLQGGRGYGSDGNQSAARPLPISALHLMDKQVEVEELFADKTEESAAVPQILDWVSYVDEMYRRLEQGNEQEEPA